VTAPLDIDVAIETPEHIVFRHRVAGPARRFFAYLIDLALCLAALFALLIVVSIAGVGASSVEDAMSGAMGFGLGLWLLLLFASQWIYFGLLEGWTGRTIGKRALGLRVVTTQGRPIGWRAAALRNILRFADALPITLAGGVGPLLFGALASIVGGTSMALTSRFQRLGDLVAGTMVIVPERATATSALKLAPPASADELSTLPHDVALDADERLAIELFLRRRHRLGRARELELANMIAAPLARRFGMRGRDPSRTLALLYDRAANAGRDEAPVSSRGAQSWR
jgi:uncharacterized RDD family membrane protein YckC